MDQSCILCGTTQWQPLPSPAPDRSLTTSGSILDRSLGKAQCGSCGLVQLVAHPYLANTDYYERQYAYYKRTGAETVDVARYRSLAEWMTGLASPFQPGSILDVGCGRGWTMRAMQDLHPAARVSGIEPTEDEVAIARIEGLDVVQMKLGTGTGPRPTEQYDLIYCNNVLQHTADPLAFLADLKALASADGLILVSCPDASIPDIEMLMGDQNFSFAPAHLAEAARRAGLQVLRWGRCPAKPGLRNEHAVLLRMADRPALENDSAEIPSFDIKGMYAARSAYLNGWKSLDAYLCDRVKAAKRVINFGAGLFSYLLAAYCPDYWKQVPFCTMDHHKGQCMGKEVVPIQEVERQPGDYLVFGTNPQAQAKLAERFKGDGFETVSWTV